MRSRVGVPLCIALAGLCAAAQEGSPGPVVAMDSGNLVGPRESCRQSHTFEASREGAGLLRQDFGAPRGKI